MLSRSTILCGAVVLPAVLLTSCGGGSTPTTVITRSPIVATLSAASLTIAANSSAAPPLTVTITRPSGDTDSVSITLSNLPNGVAAQITQPGTGNSGSVVLTVPSSTPPGTYTITVQSSDSVTTASNTLTVIVPVTISLQYPSPDQLAGAYVQLARMSTSFQPASWSVNTFANAGSTKEAELNTLAPQHIRLQPVEAGTPETSPGVWDFSTLNAVLDPVIVTADKSPELQLARAPEYLYSGTTLPATAFGAYAQYAANMVKYYNTHTGFVDGTGVTHSHVADSPSAGFTPITYWGIYNEPNYNGVSASDYLTLYQMTVAAMQAAGSEVPIKFLALELGDGYSPEQQAYFNTFFSQNAAQVDVIATHYYGTCNHLDTDQTLFNQVTQAFVPEVEYISGKMSAYSVQAPLWVTENNVNADYSNNGISACNGGPFVLDPRGTSAFFAAWRPFVFLRLYEQGVSALYQWQFDGDQQYGEVDDNGNKYLSYWVDNELSQRYQNRQLLLNYTSNEPSESQTVDVLPTFGTDGTFTVMLINHGVASPTDNNGTGIIQNVALSFSNVPPAVPFGVTTLDANTNVDSGPTTSTMSLPSNQILSLTLNGYGTTFITLGELASPGIKKPAVQPRALSGILTTDDSDNSTGDH